MWCARACARVSAAACVAGGVSANSRPTPAARARTMASRTFATRAPILDRLLDPFLTRIGRVGPVGRVGRVDLVGQVGLVDPPRPALPGPLYEAARRVPSAP